MTLAHGTPVLAQEAAILEPGRVPEAEARVPFVFEGFVFTAEGTPAEGALVVASAGGKAVVDRSGFYSLEAQVPLGVECVQVTATGSDGQRIVASVGVDLSATRGHVRVDPLTLAQLSACQPSWLPTFGEQPGTNAPVYALAAYDDGGGPALYAAGAFTIAEGVPANYIAKWDGSSWAALGSGMDFHVVALAVHDDGSGPALYAGGFFTTAGGVPASRIAKWDGSSWAALGSGMNGSVSALEVYDDGSGPALYAGGGFTSAGGVPANLIAKWDGSSWAALGSGMNCCGVGALAVYDDGGGPALFAGGAFTNAGYNYTAKWDGSGWAAIGTGVNWAVGALAVYDDGTGPALYASGLFTTVGGVPVNHIAKWDGSSWATLGSGLDDGVALAFAVYDDGGGPALYAAGDFTSAGGVPASRIARWDGSSWAALGSGIVIDEDIYALAVYDDGGGPALYAGGDFTFMGSVFAPFIARLDLVGAPERDRRPLGVRYTGHVPGGL
jgi:hypothetical protein